MTSRFLRRCCRTKGGQQRHKLSYFLRPHVVVHSGSVKRVRSGDRATNYTIIRTSSILYLYRRKLEWYMLSILLARESVPDAYLHFRTQTKKGTENVLNLCSDHTNPKNLGRQKVFPSISLNSTENGWTYLFQMKKKLIVIHTSQLVPL